MTVLRSRFLAGVLLALALLCINHGLADEPKSTPAPLPPALSKPFPENPDDLRAIEQQVQTVVHKVLPAVVGVRLGAGQGSGVIISKDGYVLTAGHVSGKPGRDVQVILPDGRKLKAKTLGRNSGVDSGLIKIAEEGNWPYVEMGKSREVHRAQWVIAVGHPGGFRPNRSPVVRVGRVLLANKYLIRTDCTIVGGDSGGPLFDMTGRVIGIHSRIGGAITENVHVPVDNYHEGWDRLVKGESWGGALGQMMLVQSPGGKVVLQVEGKLTRDDPKDTEQMECHQKVHKLKMAPGSVYTIDLVSPDFKRLDPFLRLENSASAQLTEDDDGGGNLNARIVFRPVREDEYRIIVTSCNPGEVGPYKLLVRQMDLRESGQVGRVDVLRALGIPKPPAPVLFDKLSQVGIALYANVTLFDAKGHLIPGKDLSFHWALGDKTLKTDANGVVRLELKKETVQKLFAEVPQDYKAAFEVIDGNGNFFPLNLSKDFTKERVKSGGGKIALREEGQITEGDPFDSARKKCRHKVHLFKMVPGATYTLDLESSDFDAYLRLEDATGRQLAEDDDGAGNLNSRIVIRLAKEDTVRIIVTTCDPEQTGSYRLTIRQAENKNEEKKQEKK